MLRFIEICSLSNVPWGCVRYTVYMQNKEHRIRNQKTWNQADSKAVRYKPLANYLLFQIEPECPTSKMRLKCLHQIWAVNEISEIKAFEISYQIMPLLYKAKEFLENLSVFKKFFECLLGIKHCSRYCELKRWISP